VSFWKRLLLLSSCLVIGCASRGPQRVAMLMHRPAACQDFFQRLDAAVAQAGVRDAASVPIPGFPYLRANRFLAALKGRVQDPAAKQQWLDLMQQLDLQTREKEILNLPDRIASSFRVTTTGPEWRRELLAEVDTCSVRLLEHDRMQPQFFQTLQSLVHIPGEYSTLREALGLYPLASIPVALFTERVRHRLRTWFETDLKALPVRGVLIPFTASKQTTLPPGEVAALMAASTNNRLHIPQLSQRQAHDLACHFAPVLWQDVAASYDRPGEIVAGSQTVAVDPHSPTLYYYFSHAFLRNQPILQVNYVTWYSQRAGADTPWIERGRLDGLTVRISLEDAGSIFLVEVMHNCGCYQLFAPRQDQIQQIKAQGSAQQPFVPQWLPKLVTGRPGIRVSSGWHQVERVLAVDEEPLNAERYTLMPYESLESLPDGSGRRVSMFDPHGIVPGSERLEPFILFSMGIPSLGSMRQRGHHAIQFAGRAYFDDPYLFEKNFVVTAN
jgi:hypothetical protein